MKATVAGYARAQDLPEVFRMLESGGADAQVIAGGQSLVASLNLRLSDGASLIDIRDIPELRGITCANGILRIGAMTRHCELAASSLVATHAPLLTQAVPLIAHAAIRTRGTIGGSLAHADPAAELPACVVALGGHVVVQSARGTRRIAAEDFIEGLFMTALEEGELITAIELPIIGDDERHCIRELTRRSGDYALVGLAAVRRGTAVRLTYFGVGDAPVLAHGAMAVLTDGGTVADAVAALADDLSPESDTHASASYRRHLAGVLLARVMDELSGQTSRKEAVQ